MVSICEPIFAHAHYFLFESHNCSRAYLPGCHWFTVSCRLRGIRRNSRAVCAEAASQRVCRRSLSGNNFRADSSGLPRGLRRWFTAACLLGLWIRIPTWEWMSVVSVVCCQVEVSAASWSLVQRSLNECVYHWVQSGKTITICT